MPPYHIEIDVNAKIDALEQVQKALDEINGRVGVLSESTGKMESVMTGAMMNIGAQLSNLAMKVPSFAAVTIQAFGRQEMAVQKVSEAIRTQGGRVSEVLPIMQNLASEIQRITTYGDEQVLEMQAMASAMGVNSAQMEGAIRTAIGLSSALGMDVMTAVKAASAAVQGKTGALQAYIPALSKCKTEAEKLAEVQKLAASGFAQAEAGVDTLDGRLKQCANAWGDLQEVIGEAFAPAVKNVATMLRVVCELVTSMPIAVKALTLSLTSLAVGFAFTKVGGLLKVADSFLGVAGGVRTTTAAMHGLNAAVRANPLGLLATAVTAAILGISQLVEYVSSLTDAEDEEAQKTREAYEARRREAAEIRKAAGVIADYEAELKKANASASDTAESIEKLSAEIASLEAAQGNGATNAVENAQKLVEKKRELAELQKLYVERVKAAAAAEFESMTNREVERKYQVEKDLNAARAVGIERIVKFREAELAHVELAQKALEIQKKYYADHAHLVNSEQDRVRIMTDAEKFAKMKLGELQQEADTRKWLNAETESAKTRQHDLELEILRARASGNEELARELEAQQRIARLSAEIFEASRKEGMTRAELEALARSANAQARERIDLEKSITDETARQADEKRTRQLSAELDILRARASGNESLARELEAQRRIAQLANEIFESSRREGMSRAELEALQNSANAQARERFNLEKSITDEAQRQNLAKNAQAKIEDIILANKIEQLKSEGKIAEAQELEQEREIKRTMAGLQGVSEEDKKKLADMMRQTNDFKASQNGQLSAGGVRGGEDFSSALSRKNSMMGGMSAGGQNTLTSGGRGRNGMPATVSAKYADKYAQFKEARKSGAIGANVGWTDFRDGKTGVGGVSKERRQAQARGILDSAGETARQMSGLAPKGVADSASSLMSPRTQRKNPAAKAAQPTPATADAALGQELQKRGSDGKGGDPKKNTDNIEKMTKALDDCLQSLKDIKNNTAAMATKKKDN